MTRSLNVSEARKRLFELVDEVTSRETDVVLIEHRDRAKRAALVSEERLRSLEATVAALRAAHASEFRLAGSVRLGVSENEMAAAMARSRQEQAKMAERKLNSIL